MAKISCVYVGSGQSSDTRRCTSDQDRLVDYLLGVSHSCELIHPRARGARKHFVCTSRRDQMITLESVPLDAKCRVSFSNMDKLGFDYFTLNFTAHYVPFPILISDRSLKFFTDKIRGDIESFLLCIEKNEGKNLFRLAIEAKFGKEYWRFPVSAKNWGPKDSNTLKREKDGTVFHPRVEESAIGCLIRGITCLEEVIIITLKFVIHDGPARGMYAALIREDLTGRFVTEIIYRSADVDCRNRFDLIIPGRRHDIRIGDTAAVIVMEREDGVIRQISNAIASSMKRVSEGKLSLVLKGSTMGCNWNVHFIRQRDQKEYNWGASSSYGWRLSVFKADQYTFSEEDLTKTREGSPFTVTAFEQSRNEVELCGPKYYPQEVKEFYPNFRKDVPWHVFNWNTDEVLDGFTEFMRESFHVAKLLDSS